MSSGMRLAQARPKRGAEPAAPSPRAPVILHAALPGRLRLHLPGWLPAERAVLERRLGMIPGVREVSAVPETGNVLLLYDPAVTNPTRLTQAAARATVPDKRRARPIGQTRAGGGAKRSVTSRGPTRSSRLARAVLLNFPSILALIVSLLTCATPLGAARVGLEAVQLALQITSSSA